MDKPIRSHTDSPADPRASRRSFLKLAGIGGAVLVASGCDSDDDGDDAFGSVSGTVTNAADGSPIADAMVALVGTSISATTGSDGTYTIGNVPAGVYTATAMAADFQTSEEQEITVTGDGSATADFALTPGAMTVTLDFSNVFGALNFAYALEQLEAGFYATVVDDPGFASTFSSDEQEILRDLAAHEAIHRDFFRAGIEANMGTPIPMLRPDFSAVDFGSRMSVLATAQTFEDLGVAAYNGAGQYLIDSDTFLTLAGKIVSVEARHASVIAGLLEDNAIAADDVIDDDGLDRALPPGDVVAAANGFLFDELVVTNLPA
jgi:hypothetical protein